MYFPYLINEPLSVLMWSIIFQNNFIFSLESNQTLLNLIVVASWLSMTHQTRWVVVDLHSLLLLQKNKHLKTNYPQHHEINSNWWTYKKILYNSWCWCKSSIHLLLLNDLDCKLEVRSFHREYPTFFSLQFLYQSLN